MYSYINLGVNTSRVTFILCGAYVFRPRLHIFTWLGPLRFNAGGLGNLKYAVEQFRMLVAAGSVDQFLDRGFQLAVLICLAFPETCLRSTPPVTSALRSDQLGYQWGNPSMYLPEVHHPHPLLPPSLLVENSKRLTCRIIDGQDLRCHLSGYVTAI